MAAYIENRGRLKRLEESSGGVERFLVSCAVAVVRVEDLDSAAACAVMSLNTRLAKTDGFSMGSRRQEGGVEQQLAGVRRLSGADSFLFST